MTILAIDPGPLRSAWVVWDGRHPWNFASEGNEDLRVRIMQLSPYDLDAVVIEKVEGYGMAVGAEIFETVYWSGRFAEAASPLPVHRIGRKAVKVHLCGTTKAKDVNVRQALLDRFGSKGTKADPGPLYGISGDVWSALAVAVTFHDLGGGQP